MLVLAVVREEEIPRCFLEMQTHTPQWRRSRRGRFYLHSRHANRGSQFYFRFLFYVCLVLIISSVVLPVASPPGKGTRQRPDGGGAAIVL